MLRAEQLADIGAWSDRDYHTDVPDRPRAGDAPLGPVDARAIRAFADRVRRELGEHVVSLRLFGSKARGDAAADSDIDVLVVVRPDSERLRLESAVSDIGFDVSLDHGVHLSPCVLTTGVVDDPMHRQTPFLLAVAREGVPV